MLYLPKVEDNFEHTLTMKPIFAHLTLKLWEFRRLIYKCTEGTGGEDIFLVI